MDARIDAYIEKQADFAKPLLNHLRALVHKTCPEIEEAVKWGMPFFTLNGKNLCQMAAFKQHVAFGFWEGLDIDTPKADEAMGHFGRVQSLGDLPDDATLSGMIIDAAHQIGTKVKAKPAKKKPIKVPPLPDDFADAIALNAPAQKTWDDFAPSHRKEYIEWVIEAKRDATRYKRIAQAVEWMAEGKDRNWKYR